MSELRSQPPTSLPPPPQEGLIELPPGFGVLTAPEDVVNPGAAMANPNAAEFAAQETAERRERRRGRVAKFLSGIAIVGSLFMSEAKGAQAAIDMTLDHVYSAGAVVESAFPTDDPIRQAAVERVAADMQDLDDHNNQAITDRARQFEASHADQLLSKEKTAEYQEKITRANAPEEVASIMDSFMGFYGKSAKLKSRQDNHSPVAAFDLKKSSLDSLKQTALGVTDAFSPLPKPAVSEDSFSTLLLGSPVLDKEGNVQAGGNYLTVTERQDGVSTQHAFLEMPAINSPNPSIDSISDTRIKATKSTLHELTHSTDNEDEQNSHITTGQQLTGFGESFVYSVRDWVDYPEHVSEYAAANDGGEQRAEAAAFALTPNDANKLAHPDDGRAFLSPANKAMIEQLVNLEAQFPGITANVIDRVGLNNAR